MKNFNKKAIFAAITGALSSVFSFAMEETKISKGKTLDNTQLYQSQINRHFRFLNKNDPDLEIIFKQIATIYYDNFDGTQSKPLNPGIVTNKKRLQVVKNNLLSNEPINLLKNHIKTQNVLNLGLDLEDKYFRQDLIDSTARDYFNQFIKNNSRFLIYFSTYGDVNGFVKFNEFDNEIDIVFLATRGNKTNIGIGGSMIKLLQQKYNYIELISANDNAIKFYEHMGFTHELFQMVWRKINQNYSI